VLHRRDPFQPLHRRRGRFGHAPLQFGIRHSLGRLDQIHDRFGHGFFAAGFHAVYCVPESVTALPPLSWAIIG